MVVVLFPKSTGPGPPVPPDIPRIGATLCSQSWLFEGTKAAANRNILDRSNGDTHGDFTV
jgi:hypothetical protein